MLKEQSCTCSTIHSLLYFHMNFGIKKKKERELLHKTVNQSYFGDFRSFSARSSLKVTLQQIPVQN